MKKAIFAIFVLMICVDAHALKPAETFGIKLVPQIFAEKLMDCEYLGEVATRSLWGGLVAGSLGKKGVMKRLYRKANRLHATHIMLIESAETAYSGFTAGSAQAFNCTDENDPGGLTFDDLQKVKGNPEVARDLTDQAPSNTAGTQASNESGSQLRAVTETSKADCEFIKSVMKGAGGSGDPSDYLDEAMEKALNAAARLGADSYFVINMDTTASGASVIVEALRCN